MSNKTGKRTREEIKKGTGEKAKNRSFAKRLKSGAVILLLFALIYVPSLYNWFQGDKITSDLIRTGYIERSVNTDALIIREEELLPSVAFDGKFIPEVNEGERVPAYGPVAAVSNAQSVDLIERMEEVNKKIIQAQNEIIRQTDFFSEDIKKINRSIGTKVQEIIRIENSGVLGGIGKVRTEIDELIEKKATIAGEGSSDSYLNSLKKERESIQKLIDSNTSRIRAQKPGIASFVIDGYENYLKPGNINSLTIKLIEDILDKSSENNGRRYEENVKAGVPFAKLINSNQTYLACILNEAQAGLFEAEKNVTVRIYDLSAKIKGTVAYKSDRQDGRYIAVVRIDRCAENLSDKRKVNVDIVRESAEGLKVPIKSLYDANEKAGTAKIMLIKANVTTERQVVILGMNEEYAIIKTPDGELKKNGKPL
jgi:putative membrane fusion protein